MQDNHQQNHAPANLENDIAQPTVQTCFIQHGCKVVPVFSEEEDSHLRKDVAGMLLAIFSRIVQKETG